MTCETCGMVCCVCLWTWCDLCDSAASFEYQMVTVPGPSGCIPLCDRHAEPFLHFAGTLTDVA